MDIDAARVSERFPAAAEYLSCIYLILRDYGRVTNTRLAAWSGVSGSAVTQALGRLKKLGLARQVRYESIELTEEGRSLAKKVLRRHYLLEHLMVRILDYPWEKADDEAKRLQSQISDDLTEHLFQKLGSPQTCPHGNPLPGSAIEAMLLAAPRLSEAATGQVVKILRITEEGEQVPGMLELCRRLGIRPGTVFQVTGKDVDFVRLVRIDPPVPSAPPAEVAFPLERSTHVRYETPSQA
jgi:DtxR family transcriptional regulator, Mn-dependent transcriptional regulator